MAIESRRRRISARWSSRSVERAGRLVADTISLHAVYLRFQHPVTGQDVAIQSRPRRISLAGGVAAMVVALVRSSLLFVQAQIPLSG